MAIDKNIIKRWLQSPRLDHCLSVSASFFLQIVVIFGPMSMAAIRYGTHNQVAHTHARMRVGHIIRLYECLSFI